ncbi:hypothetical protein [Nocardia ninae]|uniref:hypothetical protein n=1 Tax=Nocardia ninae TaxID=356145 RepID=UPI001649F035|nr:hypothetical protein [Nocardia ninae]
MVSCGPGPRPDGTRASENASAPAVLAAYGPDDAERPRACGLDGTLTEPSRARPA